MEDHFTYRHLPWSGRLIKQETRQNEKDGSPNNRFQHRLGIFDQNSANQREAGHSAPSFGPQKDFKCHTQSGTRPAVTVYNSASKHA
jgi:hypothetical protein